MKKQAFWKIFLSLLALAYLLCACSGGEAVTDSADTESESEFVSPEISEGTDILHEGYGENERFVVVIDAGHQKEGMYGLEPVGPDAEEMKTQVAQGAEGAFTGIPEYELTLEVSLSLRDELLRRGYTVVMVRETHDVQITNMERALLANGYAPSEENRYEYTVNLRIHANAVDNKSVRGALVCHPSFFNPYPVGELYGECRELSKNILESYSETTGIPIFSNGYMPTDDMTGTNFCKIPTTILEMGFMTNETDDRLMATDGFKADAARGIADGIDDFFDDYKQNTDITNPTDAG